jgi:hypothetical protein
VIATSPSPQGQALQSGDPAVAFTADRFLGAALLVFGRLAEARLCTERALQSHTMPDNESFAI